MSQKNRNTLYPALSTDQNSRPSGPSTAFDNIGMSWRQTREKLQRRLRAVIVSHTAQKRKFNFHEKSTIAWLAYCQFYFIRNMASQSVPNPIPNTIQEIKKQNMLRQLGNKTLSGF